MYLCFQEMKLIAQTRNLTEMLEYDSLTVLKSCILRLVSWAAGVEEFKFSVANCEDIPVLRKHNVPKPVHSSAELSDLHWL